MPKNGIEVEPSLLSLDERIAFLLLPEAEQPSSTALADLLAEVDTAIDDADQVGREARARSTDPAIIDIGARKRAEDLEFRAARLRNGEARLKELHKAALAREYEQKWLSECADVELAVVKVAHELLVVYPKVVDQLVDLFKLVKQVNAHVNRMNGTAPPGILKRVRDVEALARGVSYGEGYFIDQVKLPTLIHGHGATQLAWPPPAPNVGLEYYNMVLASVRGAPPPPTDAERVEASARHIAAGIERERGSERLRAEQAARADAHAAEMRRLAAGELPV